VGETTAPIRRGHGESLTNREEIITSNSNMNNMSKEKINIRKKSMVTPEKKKKKKKKKKPWFSRKSIEGS